MEYKACKVFMLFNRIRKLDGLNKDRLKRYSLNNQQTLILLSILQDDNLSQKDLVNKFNAPKQTVNASVMDLKEKKLVDTVSAESDKRRKILILTDEGKKEAQRISEPLQKSNLEIYEKLGEARISQLMDDFDQLIEILEKINYKEV